MHPESLVPRSAVPGIFWPAIPGKAAAAMLALQYQLEQSQWWPAATLRECQFRQLGTLVRHAFETVPYYREQLQAYGFDSSRPLDEAAFTRLPLLTRHEVQEAGERLLSTRIPPSHGRTMENKTAGSTGHPVCVKVTEMSGSFWLVFTLRDHFWHRRDLQGRFAIIRSKVETQALPGWGAATDMVYQTGSAAVLDVATDVERQLAWLREQAPNYLLTLPTNLRALAQLALERGERIPNLRAVRTFGEMLHPDLRDLCRNAWDVPLTDLYSAEEVGYVALQCPEHEHYHLQAEGVLTEVLDEEGRPCAPGETGRVVVTPLHNFAMPLIRYALGDYAEVGEPCACGRGLPVLRRIRGRQRNMVVLPDGTRHWPSLPAELALLPVRRRQVIQRSLQRIDVNLEVRRPLTPEEEHRLVEALQRSLGYPFPISLNYVERVDYPSVADPASFKYEDFVSEVSAGGS